MSGETFGHTNTDVAKAMKKESKKHDKGQIPADSEAARLQSLVDQATKDKESVIAERQANLPLPEQPPGPSDFNSANEETVNVGSGGRQDDVTRPGTTELREPAVGDPASKS